MPGLQAAHARHPPAGGKGWWGRHRQLCLVEAGGKGYSLGGPEEPRFKLRQQTLPERGRLKPMRRPVKHWVAQLPFRPDDLRADCADADPQLVSRLGQSSQTPDDFKRAQAVQVESVERNHIDNLYSKTRKSPFRSQTLLGILGRERRDLTSVSKICRLVSPMWIQRPGETEPPDHAQLSGLTPVIPPESKGLHK